MPCKSSKENSAQRAFPLISFTKPTATTLHEFVAEQTTLDLTYKEVGATRGELPADYYTHRVRRQIGEGEAAFARAKAALQHWSQFKTDWTELFPTDALIEQGTTVAVLAHVLGVWSLNSCRIVYVLDAPKLFGFGYGTLPGHAEVGEERFLVEQMDNGGVWYEATAFFRPRKLLTKLAWPYLRRKVDRFREDSAAAMKGATDSTTSPATC